MCLLLILDVCLFNVIKIWFELKKIIIIIGTFIIKKLLLIYIQ